MNGVQVTSMKMANAASTAARKKLIAAHQDEYNGYLAEERVTRGLPANTEYAKLVAKREKLERELAKINERLA